MISSAHRFHGRSSLRFVYQRGQVLRDARLTLRYVQNNRQTAYRVAVVVSRKTSKSAVVRNRIRRRLYEIIRLSAPHFRAPYDIVLTVYGEDVAKVPHAMVRQSVVHLLEKAGIVPAGVISEAEHGIVEEKETNT